MFSWILLGGLVIVIAALGSMFLWHLCLGVPYVPTPSLVVEKMIDMAELQPGDVVLDLGAGDGRFLLEAQKRCPGIRAIGYELVPLVWLLGYFKTRGRSGISFRLGDARKADVSQATVIFLYVTPSFMAQLESHFHGRVRPGTRIITYTFTLPNHTPVASLPLRSGGKPMIYRYIYP